MEDETNLCDINGTTFRVDLYSNMVDIYYI